MGKVRVTKNLSILLLLVCSLALNVLFILKRVRVFDDESSSSDELSWSRRPAREAERVAAISCSGHGRAFIDSSLVVDEEEEEEGPVCECNSCYAGSHCQNFLPSCPVNAKSGDPLFLEPFWMENAESSAMMVAGWHRMSYTFKDSGYMSKQLKARLRQMHAIVGNAVTEGRYIIFGSGSTQLINAAVHALSSHNSYSPSLVVPRIPYYSLYKQQTEFFQEVEYKFEDDASLWMNDSATNNLIEIVTSPNNPDGQLNHARLQHPNDKAIYDRFYYWSHFTAISSPADDDIMLFSLSKFIGHAGTRFGWAVVKDETVFTRMSRYLTLNTVGVSHESQLRALRLMKVIIQGKEEETMFDFGYKTMRNRWEKLNDIVSISKRFSLQNIEFQYCNFFHKIRAPSPAFAWLKCLRKEEKDCHAVLAAANIMGCRGSTYGAEDKFVRLSLVGTQDDFDHLLHQVKILISEEKPNRFDSDHIPCDLFSFL
ncbi:tryptophan aminotransferase-related protein 4-like [Humulus lupulus]|uniref:tryptophan aminotransferase-related protein 4-like n=1 Tax=Humulus lupulus TaxID=3486 RepID=UPI002B409142|nr:tryptophan aminotransferase-related protein 4-like [Humulus lupulus]